MAHGPGLNMMTVTSQHQPRFVGLRAAAALISLLCAVAAPPSVRGSELRLRAGAYDPTMPSPTLPSSTLQGATSTQPTARDQRAQTSLWIVQHDGRIPARWRQQLQADGVTILGHIPDDAYLIRVDPRRIATLESIPGTRAVVPYRPVDRVAPELAAHLVGAGDGPDPTVTDADWDPAPVQLRVWGCLDAVAEALATRAQHPASGVVLLQLEVSPAGRPSLLLDLPSAALAATVQRLAADEHVEFVERTWRPEPLNGDASWLLQTGVVGSRPLFTSHGLTGVGQIGAVADMGLDADACQFKFGVGSGTPANMTQPPAVNVTHPNDKVISYYLMTGADVGDSANILYHGSRVAGCIAGDNFASPASAVPRTAPFTFAAPDTGDGMAPGAQLVVQDLGTGDGYFVAGLNQGALLEQAYGSGARVHNASFGLVPIDVGSGFPTFYDGSAAAVDEALWRLRDLTAVWAAGNWGAVDPSTSGPWDGRQSLAGLGAVAKSSLTVGASGNPGAAENAENLASESSRGPTLEGLLKPDVLAPGHDLTALGSSITDPTCETGRLSILGTSFAAGTASGMALLTRQYFTDGYYPGGARTRANPNPGGDPVVFEPSNALIKSLLINSARSLTGANTADRNTTNCSPPVPGCSAPNPGQGWGRIQLDDSLFFAADTRRLRVLRDLWNGGDALSNAGRGDDPQPKGAIVHREVHNYSLQLLQNVTPALPLRCTLVWSDAPGSPAAAEPLVNDLDLEVHDPGLDQTVGTADDIVYRGNQFRSDAPFSEPMPTGWDRRNPVENVFIEFPNPGVYNLRVTGTDVPGNGMTGVAAEPPSGPSPIDSTRQGYALVCTSDESNILNPPVVEASGLPNPAVGCVGLMVDFVETACTTCSEWIWDFGDGNTGSGAAVSHTFMTPGLFLVSVVGRDPLGAEARSAFPIEVIVGTTAPPTMRVGNTVKVVKTPTPGDHRVTWRDIPVPAATSYNLYEFIDRREVSTPPPVVPQGMLLNVPPLPLHGNPGFLWTPDPLASRYLQVRAANCLGEPGP